MSQPFCLNIPLSKAIVQVREFAFFLKLKTIGVYKMTQTNTNEKTQRILAVDTGFGDTKVCYKTNGDKKLLKFSSVVIRHIDKGIVLDDSVSQSTSCYEWESDNYCVADDNVFGDSIYARNISYLIKYAPLLVKHAMAKLDIKPADIDVLVVGLPLMNLKDHKDELVIRLKHFTVNGLDYDFSNIVVVGQGIGGFFDHIDTNNVLNGELGYVLDIGFNTVIGLSYNGRKIVSNDCFQLDKTGMSTIIYNVAEIVSKRHKIEVNPIDVKNAFLDKQVISVRGESVDLTTDFKREVQSYIETTIFKLFDKYGTNFNKLKSIYLIGGGAYHLKEKIPTEYKKMFIIANNPEYANVRGYVVRAEQTLQG